MNFLFLRGLGRNSLHWHKFEEEFKTNENQILTLDTIGNGEFYQLKSPINIKEQTNFLRKEFLKRKTNNSPWMIISISMGSMIALDWSNRFPADFNKIVCINTSSKDVLRPYERFNLKVFFKLPYLLFTNLKNQEEEILKNTLNIKNINQELIELNVLASKISCSKINFIRQLVSAARFMSPPSLQVQILFLASRNDRLVNALGAIRLAQKYKQQLLIHEEAGHDLPLDDKSWTIKSIKNFI